MVNLTIKDLFHEKFRIVLVILGLTVSFLMVHVGMGMMTGSVDQNTRIVDAGDYDCYIIQSNRANIMMGGSVSDEMYDKVESISGVEHVDKFIDDWLGVRYKDDDTGVRLVGFKIKTQYFDLWDCIDCDKDDIKSNNSVIVDTIIHKYFPELQVKDKIKAGAFEDKLKVKGFCENNQVMGNARMWSNFGTAQRLLHMENKSTYLAVKLKDGYSVNMLKDRLKRYDDEIKVLSAEEMKEAISDYLLYGFGLASSIGIIAAMGFFVAMIIISITLYQSIVEKIPELVSLKALGARKGLINNILISQTVFIVSISYGISIILAILLAPILSFYSALPVGINPVVSLITFGISLGLGILCSLFSIRKVHKTDPAIIFRA
ncbi:MAG: ABC transporter permease [Promethearchaeota archaeon]